MKKRRRSHSSWQTEAFFALSRRLRPFENALRRRRLLELHCGLEVGVSSFLDWWQPAKLVSVAVEPTSHAGKMPSSPDAFIGDAAYDAVFVVARSQLKRAVRHVSFADVARVLAPGGLLVVATLERMGAGFVKESFSALDRSAEAWGTLHASLKTAGLAIAEEHFGANRLLVAQKSKCPSVEGSSAMPALSAPRSTRRSPFVAGIR